MDLALTLVTDVQNHSLILGHDLTWAVLLFREERISTLLVWLSLMLIHSDSLIHGFLDVGPDPDLP